MTERALHRAALPIVVAVLCAAYALIFYPGAMGFDTAYQWWQARGGETTNIHGLGMTWLWRVADIFDAGPAPLFLLQLVLFCAGVGLVAGQLRCSPFWRITFILVATLAPVCFVLFSFVASDVMFMAVLACAFGLLLPSDGGRRTRVAGAMALLCLAALLRKNAPPAIFPLLVYAFHVTNADLRSGRRGTLRGFALATAATVVMLIGVALLERTVDRRVSIFPATALWDLAAVSLATNKILLPPASHGPGLTLDDLRGAVVPYANTMLFERTRAGMRQPFLEPGDPLREDVGRAWIRVVIDHPQEYLAHRWRVTCALFGSKRADWPHELIYFNDEHQYDGNPPVTVNTGAAHEWLVALFERLRSTEWMAAWPYLVAALIAGLVAWRRRDDWQARAAVAVIASGLFYAAPLPLIAPSAELRYVGWPCLAAVLGTALALSSLRMRSAGVPNGLTSSARATTLRAP